MRCASHHVTPSSWTFYVNQHANKVAGPQIPQSLVNQQVLMTLEAITAHRPEVVSTADKAQAFREHISLSEVTQQDEMTIVAFAGVFISRRMTTVV